MKKINTDNIESERMRKQFIEDIEHWARHTKVEQYLRDYDIPGLASTLLDRIYRVHLSCCHSVRELDEGITLATKDNEGVCYGDYCAECARVYRANGYVLETEDEINKHMSSVLGGKNVP